MLLLKKGESIDPSKFLYLWNIMSIKFPNLLFGFQELVICCFCHIVVHFIGDLGDEGISTTFELLEMSLGSLAISSSHASLGGVLGHLLCKILDIGCCGMS